MTIPSFFIYGEPDKPLDVGFIHVETLMKRRQMHFGSVKAHKHDRMSQITFWTQGRGVYFLEDQQLDFIAPAVSFVPSGVVHGFEVAPDVTDAIVVSVADSAVPPIQTVSTLEFDRHMMVRGQPEHTAWGPLRAIMSRLLDDYQEGRLDSLSALMAVASNDIARLGSLGIATAQGGDELAQAFKRLVNQHFRENWSVERYVDNLGVTPHLLAKASRQSYGKSIKSFIDERRLLEAKRLLLFTVRSVEDIAYEIGFYDPAYFSRFFRMRTGAPPGEWRVRQTRAT